MTEVAELEDEERRIICSDRKGQNYRTMQIEPLITDTAGEFKFCPL
jgi:hypothetical protein